MKFELEIENKKLVAEISDLAEQTNGACFLRYGDTLILSTAVMSKYEKKDLDFFPLTVEYEERYYAAGKIKGPRYIKREGRPSDKAICNARLVDRAIRPLFPKNFKKEVQVVNTVLSWDGKNDPDILGLIASSIALHNSDVPWQGPISAIRISKLKNNFILNPTYEEREKSEMNLLFAATESSGRILINMIEGEFEEIKEEVVLDALRFGKPYLKKIIEFQKKIAEDINRKKISLEEQPIDQELEKEIRQFLGERLEKALFQLKKEERVKEIDILKNEMSSLIESKYPDKINYAKNFFEKEIERLIYQNIIEKDRRPDGRKWDEIRPLHCQAGLLPRTHGSGLFCRGQTKSLSILTLGTPKDVQLLEGMEIVGKKRFMHHYNFPPYSVGEIKPMRGPGRREIGHGMLVEKALLPLIPSLEEFPYTIRIVSEILSSNGSTSMAAVSSSCLALMDAGVPIKRPGAGISIGLMQSDDENYKILTDIQGPEDQHGDMDLKIAGTEEGITAIQMDVKIAGISEKILEEALGQGKKNRLQILQDLKKVLERPRPELSPFAPRILTLQISPEKIREVIGPGGRVINEIIEKCDVSSIDIEETGKVFVGAETEEAAKKAIAWIKNITKEIKVGEIFQGKVRRILNFGVMVEILPGQEGLIHISHLTGKGPLRPGDIILVKVISLDEQGRINLSPHR